MNREEQFVPSGSLLLRMPWSVLLHVTPYGETISQISIVPI